MPVNGQMPSPTDTNPFRYRGEYLDTQTGKYYLRARCYDPSIGRFTQEDTHWNVGNMVYDSNGSVSLEAIFQSGNLYGYCGSNPVKWVDRTGEVAGLAFAGAAGAMSSAATVGATNFWNPVGWAVLAAVATTAIVVGGVAIYNEVSDKALQTLLSDLAGYVGSPMPLPPNDPKSKGTNTGGSKTLYNKKGVHIDVENNGSNVGRVHLQIGKDKYFYNINDMKFYSNKEFTKLAPKTIQNYLNNKNIIRAIIKGIEYLGY